MNSYRGFNCFSRVHCNVFPISFESSQKAESKQGSNLRPLQDLPEKDVVELDVAVVLTVLHGAPHEDVKVILVSEIHPENKRNMCKKFQ